ncbi:hypothetical protein G7B40_024935 [Aetokthonos hydrillicola Thurmond2011]|uniref:Uncharacterized protein n=1 Tax=Aetokthonos hydrillicola Thurmond2011 TaxID=2712845 RepID=A0AAP5MC16_9CYAN|nr:hypothetical protein [Aetokthonos hydrillicola Thurmond2011]
MSKYSIGVSVAPRNHADRFSSHGSNIYCTLIKIRNSGKKPYIVQWDDGKKVIA